LSEAKALARWSDCYGKGQSAVDLAIEREVFGAVIGARGYTTVAQADELADRLALRPPMRLLDIGAGRGWPGLYLAERSGCAVVLTDLPFPALRDALVRARRQGLARRCAALVASGSRLPFRPRAFDAIVHTDTL